MKCVRVIVPATTANLGSGYDVLGMALGLHNEVILEKTLPPPVSSPFSPKKGRRVEIEIEGEGEDSLPKDERNIVYQAVRLIFKRSRFPASGWRLTLKNKIPLARGLGSSAAARVGGLLAANAFCGNKFSQKAILDLAARLEGHPDNVSPAILGGLCVSAPHLNPPPQGGRMAGITAIRMGPPRRLKAVLCIPDFGLSTKKARRAIPSRIPHRDAVFNLSRAALLVSAMATRQFQHLRAGMEDRLHQDYRRKLIPGMKEVIAAALRAGALGACLSGAGPSILALASSRFEKIGSGMCRAFLRAGVKSRFLVLSLEEKGARIL